MCLDCGCGAAHDDMGEPQTHIVYEDLKRAADADGLTVVQVLANIAKTAQRDAKAHPAEYPA